MRERVLEPWSAAKNAPADLLGMAFDAFPAPMAVLDTDRRVVLKNAAAERLIPDLALGHVGTLCCKLIHDRPGPCAKSDPGCPLRQAFAGAGTATIRHEYQDAEGERRIIDVTATPLQGPDGAPAGVLQIVRDKTDAVRTEEAIHRARNEWLATADSVPALVLLTDLDQVIVRCNRAARDFLDMEYQTLIGQELSSLFRRLKCDVTALEDGSGEMQCERPRAILEVTSYPARLKGRPYGTVWVMRDVTSVRRLEVIAASVDMNNNLGHVLATVRHELGNPINAIKTALTVLRERFDSFPPEKKAAYIERCLSDVGRIQGLLENLRTFNMFDAVRCERVDLRGFMLEFRTLVEEQLDSQGISFDLHCRFDRHVNFVADARALTQVLLGLISNAADAVAARRNPRITTIAEAHEDAICIAVIDNGVGIGSDDLGMAFIPLYTTKPEGTGLGLAIARKLVTRMNGTIELQSRRGRGTRVDIALERWSRRGHGSGSGSAGRQGRRAVPASGSEQAAAPKEAPSRRAMDGDRSPPRGGRPPAGFQSMTDSVSTLPGTATPSDT